jgi:hypothetical protein
MNATIRENAKAWVALLGVIVTALLGTIPPDDRLWQILTAVAAVCTAIAVYEVPNATPAHRA